MACVDVGLHTGSAYIEEKVVYVGNIPGKTVQWENAEEILQYYNISYILLQDYVQYLFWSRSKYLFPKKENY